MISIFYVVCGVSVMFFVAFLVGCSIEEPTRRKALVLYKSPQTEAVDSIYGRRFLAHLEQQMAEFLFADCAKNQLTPRTYVARRTECHSDAGGLCTGIATSTEGLNEVTATYAFQVANAFDRRWEERSDLCNRQVFLTDQQNVSSTQQDIPTRGGIWWFGRKQGRGKGHKLRS